MYFVSVVANFQNKIKQKKKKAKSTTFVLTQSFHAEDFHLENCQSAWIIWFSLPCTVKLKQGSLVSYSLNDYRMDSNSLAVQSTESMNHLPNRNSWKVIFTFSLCVDDLANSELKLKRKKVEMMQITDTTFSCDYSEDSHSAYINTKYAWIPNQTFTENISSNCYLNTLPGLQQAPDWSSRLEFLMP